MINIFVLNKQKQRCTLYSPSHTYITQLTALMSKPIMLRIGDYDLYESMYDVVFFLFKAHLPISQIEKIFLNIFKFQMFCLLLLLLLCGLK